MDYLELYNGPMIWLYFDRIYQSSNLKYYDEISVLSPKNLTKLEKVSDETYHVALFDNFNQKTNTAICDFRSFSFQKNPLENKDIYTIEKILKHIGASFENLSNAQYLFVGKLTHYLYRIYARPTKKETIITHKHIYQYEEATIFLIFKPF